MKPLTLTQLRKAIYTIKTVKQFSGFRGALAELINAEAFLLGVEDDMPRDPRAVLTEIGYKF